MSLLPGQIIPATMPLGTLQPDGKTIIVDKNWWLFFYNLYENSIGSTSDEDAYLLAVANLNQVNVTPVASGGSSSSAIVAWMGL